MRTRIGPAASSSVAAAAAASAPGAVGKAMKKASPCVSTSTPPRARERLAQRCAGARRAPPLALRAERVQQPRRALDVREEERHRPGGQCALHRSDHARRRAAPTRSAVGACERGVRGGQVVALDVLDHGAVHRELRRELRDRGGHHLQPAVAVLPGRHDLVLEQCVELLAGRPRRRRRRSPSRPRGRSPRATSRRARRGWGRR